jgi:hypothetical protein
VFSIPYNLSLALCMKYDFIFVCIFILGVDHHRAKINMVMRLLIEDLKLLWEGVEAYNCYKEQ